MMVNYLVGSIPIPLENMKVSWDDYSQYMETYEKKVPNHQAAYVRPKGISNKIWLYLVQYLYSRFLKWPLMGCTLWFFNIVLGNGWKMAHS